MSFREAAAWIAELFPLASGRHASTIRRQVLRQADEMARAQGDTGADTALAASIELGVDTTFVRSCAAEGVRHHEVLIGVGVNDHGRVAKIGGVIGAVDRPHDLIGDALHALGRGPATTITAYSDGDAMLRGFLTGAKIEERPILDWQHIARKVHVLKLSAKGLRTATGSQWRARPLIAQTLKSLHLTLWHGKLTAARQRLDRVERLLEPFDIDRSRTPTPARRLRKAIRTFRSYIDGQSAHLVNYQQRQRAGLPIGTSEAEGLANTLVNRRMNKAQQMRWSGRGAHAVLSIRVADINRNSRRRAVQPRAA